MTKQESLQLFEERKVRSGWDDEREEWFFSVIDIIGALTDSVNPTDYFKEMRKRDEELALFVGTNCPRIGEALFQVQKQLICYRITKKRPK